MSDRPTLLKCMVEFTKLLMSRSTCSRRKVGCLITNSALTSVYAIGYNGTGAGMENKCDSEEPQKCGCIHAEVNALLKLRTEQENLSLITTLSPCLGCAKAIINCGQIKYVIFCDEYEDDSGINALIAADIAVIRFQPLKKYPEKTESSPISGGDTNMYPPSDPETC